MPGVWHGLLVVQPQMARKIFKAIQTETLPSVAKTCAAGEALTQVPAALAIRVHRSMPSPTSTVLPTFTSERAATLQPTRLCGRNPWHAFLTGSRIGVCSNHCV